MLTSSSARFELSPTAFESEVRTPPEGCDGDRVTRSAPLQHRLRANAQTVISTTRREAENRRLNEQTLDRSGLRFALDWGADGYWECDLQRNSVTFSDSWCQMTGSDRSHSEVPLDTAWGWVHPDDAPIAQQCFDRHLKGESPHYECELRWKCPDGHYLWTRQRGRVTDRDLDGTPLFMIGLATNLTEVRSSQQRISDGRNQQADVARNNVRSNMLAAIAHEVNQPLYAIKNFSLAALATLKQAENGRASTDVWYRKLHTALDTIADQVERGSRIVSELKSLSSVGRDATSRTDIHVVVAKAIQNIRLRPELADYSIDLHFDATESSVRGEGLQLELLFSNLILNAVDAAKDLLADRARIEIRTVSTATDIQIQVLDEGCGVEADAIPHLFDPYITHKSDGLGMGLAICRDIVTSCGGDITCRRRSIQGTEFIVNLPLA